ncbi:uncharacterized protein [Diadema setosum]|uniref:uncharacterized protein n=1 Tax=Diadema setosum TaxID=31175 RepID=UPI003B3B8342
MATKQSSDAESLLKDIARDIPDDEAIEDLGKELDFTVEEIKRFIHTNHQYREETSYGTLCMLRKWSHRVSPSSLRSDLREALMRARLVRIAETYLQSAPTPLPPSLGEKQVQQCKEDLKEYYRESRRMVTVDPLNFMERVSLDDIYTNLSLIDRGNMRKTPITYEDILANDESGKLSKHILIEGEGGVGKTTLSSKIAWDWCQGRILQDLDLVIVIPLRDVTDGKSMGAILKSYLPDSNAATPDQIDGYISTNVKKILLVFDGFDEFKEDIEERSNSEVIRILALEQYKLCKVIVTTRPWKSHDFKMTKKVAERYTFISVEGFSKGNLATYISQYFQIRQKNSLAESLISFMKGNDIIRSNMAPFPIYCAMLCLMWEYFTEEKRKELAKLQTFSQIFGEMISFLKVHYASKACERLQDKAFTDHLTEAGRAIQDIGEIALNGLIAKRLSFPEERFKDCHDSMETSCRVGVLTIEKNVTREKRWHDANSTSLVESVVSFPHKLFQEYVAGAYIANVYVNNRAKYNQLKQTLLPRYREFRYLLYFASSLGKELCLGIIKDLLECDDKEFCIDVAFECHTEEAAETVGEGWKEYELSREMPQHTKSGVAFIVSFEQARSLSFDEVNCGRTVSRDLAEGMCSSRVLRKVTIKHSIFHADFYKIIGDKASNCQLQDVSISIESWDDGCRLHSSIGGNLATWAFTMSSLSSFSLKCPYLDGDFLSTAIASASSCQIQDLKMSLEYWDDGSEHESSVGGDLARLVTSLPSLSSFSLDCNYLDGDFLSAAFTLASSCQIQDLKMSLEYWDDGSEHESSVGGDLARLVTSLPSLSSFSLDCNYLDGDFLSAAFTLASSCQIRHLELVIEDWGSDDSHASSLRKDLAQVICTLPHLSTFSVKCFSLPQGDFYSTAATLAQSCQIRELSMKFEKDPRQKSMSPSAATHLAEFLCHMPHLKRANINCTYLPETFFTGMTSQPANCKLEDITINGKTLK